MAVSGQRRRPVVALYERIADAVHDGTYPPGSTLPSEPKLAAELGVSRPALREALLLLQEDGLLSVRRGVGRTVNDRPPRRGFEHVQPLEELIGSGTPLRVRALLRTVEEPTDFTTQHLLAPARAELRFWESVLTGEGTAAALSHEWATADELLDRVHPELPLLHIGRCRRLGECRCRWTPTHCKNRPRPAPSDASRRPCVHEW
uniref:GntR family transcriptional regulator n=1 Tax=Streptomyces sp. MSC1_001 TaxID=2909263 RepID=UPI00203035EF